MTTFITKDGKFTQTEADLAGLGYAEDTSLPDGTTLARWQAGLEAAVRHVEFGFRATSSDSFDPSSVSSPVTLSVEKGRPFFAKGGVRVEKNGDPSTFILGQISSYDPDSDTDNLVISITDRGGSGTVSDWVVKAAGVEGPAGGVTDALGLTGSVSVDGLTEETAIADDDFIPVFDGSAGAHRKAKKSNLAPATRWTKEAEIDLSAQGGSFIVSGLPTGASMIEFLFKNVLHDNTGGSTQDLTAQISDDNGSSFFTATNYQSRSDGSTQSNVDRWFISVGIAVLPDDFEDSFSARILFRDFSITSSARPVMQGFNTRRNGNGSWVDFAYEAIPTNKINAIKFMLSAQNFSTGTLEVWSIS